jgi:hypothetical protein
MVLPVARVRLQIVKDPQDLREEAGLDLAEVGQPITIPIFLSQTLIHHIPEGV